MTGIRLLTRAGTRWPNVTRVLLTAYSDRDLLLQAIQFGRFMTACKPWRAEELGLRLRAALDAFKRHRARARAEVERDVLKDELREQTPFGIVGLEAGSTSVGALLDRVAPTDSTVMIRGEQNRQELIAREVHRRSLRAERPFVRVNCAAFSEGVLRVAVQPRGRSLYRREAGASGTL